MKNKNEQSKISLGKNTSNKKDKKEVKIIKNDKSKSPNIKSPQKMKIKLEGNLEEEIEQKSQEKKAKIKIFNNKKNNILCSELLKSTINQEKDLILIPYAKERQKINKTINTIGNAHGISYPACSVINGFLTKDKNYLVIIRDDDKKINKKKKSKLLNNNNKKENITEINLEDNTIVNNNLKEMLGNAENIQEFI